VSDRSVVSDVESAAWPDGRAVTLFHHPFCPHSRFVRMVLGEYGIPLRLVEEHVWERREAFLILNPAGTTPVLIEEATPAVPGAEIIAEYLDETRGAAQGDRRLLPEDVGGRIEVRRLTGWFHAKFFEEVTSLLVMEKVYKRYMTRQAGGGPPDTQVIHAARHNVRYHLAYIGWLMRSRNWLAGDRLSYADLAAAAHLSCVDYVGDVPWNEDEGAKNWYARVKSRPSFRPLLADLMPGIPPSPTYADLDF
jgi:glutathione S-transferase